MSESTELIEMMIEANKIANRVLGKHISCVMEFTVPTDAVGSFRLNLDRFFKKWCEENEIKLKQSL